MLVSFVLARLFGGPEFKLLSTARAPRGGMALSFDYS